jgi:hypothetical protein
VRSVSPPRSAAAGGPPYPAGSVPRSVWSVNISAGLRGATTGGFETVSGSVSSRSPGRTRKRLSRCSASSRSPAARPGSMSAPVCVRRPRHAGPDRSAGAPGRGRPLPLDTQPRLRVGDRAPRRTGAPFRESCAARVRRGHRRELPPVRRPHTKSRRCADSSARSTKPTVAPCRGGLPGSGRQRGSGDPAQGAGSIVSPPAVLFAVIVDVGARSSSRPRTRRCRVSLCRGRGT